MSNNKWGTRYEKYLQAQQSDDYDKAERSLKRNLRRSVREFSANDILWLSRALQDLEKKWFVAFVFEHYHSLPEDLFAPLLQAAIYERNPSKNRAFVEPLVRVYRAKRVMSALIDVVEHGTNQEKAGAVNALYWASVPLVFEGNPPSYEIHYATTESQAAYREVEDIHTRRREVFLKEFVNNTDVQLRRNLISQLSLNPDSYSLEIRPLVQKAITIAQTHTDEYIRHRLEVQLGRSKTFNPLPTDE